MADVLEDSRDKVQENLLANGGTVGNRMSQMSLSITPVCMIFSSGVTKYLTNFLQQNSHQKPKLVVDD